MGNNSKEAKVLDAVYLASRYPDGIKGNLTPYEYYQKEDAEECIKNAESILDEAKKFIEK